MERLDKNFLLHAYQPELYSLSKLSFPRFHRSLQYSHPISNEIFIRTSIVRSASKRRVIIKPRRASCIPSPREEGKKKRSNLKSSLSSTNTREESGTYRMGRKRGVRNEEAVGQQRNEGERRRVKRETNRSTRAR